MVLLGKQLTVVGQVSDKQKEEISWKNQLAVGSRYRPEYKDAGDGNTHILFQFDNHSNNHASREADIKKVKEDMTIALTLLGFTVLGK